MGMVEAVILTIITASTPLLLAALGELVTERSGVINLGVEGMMIMGAVSGFAVSYLTGQPLLGLAAAVLAGMAMAALFGFMTLVLVANQVATGLALTLFGLGLSGLVGDPFAGMPGVRIQPLHIPVLADIPYLGLLFRLDPMSYLAVALTIAISWFLFKSRAGLVLRAVGDNHQSAHALGYNVIRIRFMAVLFGGAMAGLGGAYLSMAYTTQWLENMTGGRGWIALALVVFATWLPFRLLLGALLFGAVGILQLHAQAFGLGIPSQFLNSLPYLTTILVLVLISRNRLTMRANTPASLGQSFVPDR